MSPEVRGDLAALSGYHSAQVEVDVRLNTNESPFTLPVAYTERLLERVASLDLNRYPDREATVLRHQVQPHDVDHAAQRYRPPPRGGGGRGVRGEWVE